jgi:hypothetical protein
LNEKRIGFPYDAFANEVFWSDLGQGGLPDFFGFF